MALDDSKEVQMIQHEVMRNRKKNVQIPMSVWLELVPCVYKSILYPLGWENPRPIWCL